MCIVPGMRASLAAGSLCLALVFAGVAQAQAEEELAESYAPIVRLVEQPEECGPGEPYRPIDVGAIFDEETVSLRGPWRSNDLVEIGPSADDLGRGLYEYNLDFPGDALNPGCDYELWARRITADTEPTVYAHVAQEAAYPDRLALQYWFYYPFNDWNNLHEGDWEMIQLVAGKRRGGARDGAGRGRLQPARGRREGGVGGRQARGRRRHAPGRLPGGRLACELLLGQPLPRPCGRDRRRLRRHDRPARRAPAAGSLDLERPGSRGGAFPWIAFEGRWGERQQAFYNGRAEPEDAVDGADHLVGGLARVELRGARRRLLRVERHRLLLRGGRGRSNRAPRRRQRSARRLRRRPPRCAGRLPPDSDLAAVDAAARRPPAFLGADLHGVVASTSSGRGSSSGSD